MTDDKRDEVDDPNEGLSLLYRVGYRIQYTLLHIFGPAQLHGPQNPHVRMRAERARRVAAARAKRLAAEGRPPETP